MASRLGKAAVLFWWLCVAWAAPVASENQMIALALHGGAGTISRGQMTAEQETAYREALTEALHAGYRVLDAGGSSLDAVVRIVTQLEDSELFNAGKGSVFTHDGRNELDASIMDGATLEAGAVAGVRHVRNPIVLARMVMERSPHVLLTGAGAEEFALSQGLALVPSDYFYTKRRWDELQRERGAQSAGVEYSDHLGTVGVVALDRDGNLAAGTSTGGTTNKRYGRVGDSPIIGAGTYANNASCAVSATGTGEYFIRSVAAHEVCALVEHRGASLQEAVDEVIERRIGALGGDGGLIAVDRQGRVALGFNTTGMYRAYIDGRGEEFVGIYR